MRFLILDGVLVVEMCLEDCVEVSDVILNFVVLNLNELL